MKSQNLKNQKLYFGTILVQIKLKRLKSEFKNWKGSFLSICLIMFKNWGLDSISVVDIYPS